MIAMSGVMGARLSIGSGVVIRLADFFAEISEQHRAGPREKTGRRRTEAERRHRVAFLKGTFGGPSILLPDQAAAAGSPRLLQIVDVGSARFRA